jgi:hypothetical protein
MGIKITVNSLITFFVKLLSHFQLVYYLTHKSYDKTLIQFDFPMLFTRNNCNQCGHTLSSETIK